MGSLNGLELDIGLKFVSKVAVGMVLERCVRQTLASSRPAHGHLPSFLNALLISNKSAPALSSRSA